MLEHAVRRFARHPRIYDIVVVAPGGQLQAAGELVDVPVVAGGATRAESVAAGLNALGRDTEFVLVHDVARPFVPARVLDTVVAELEAGADAVVPVVAIHDTIRRLDDTGALDGPVDRSTLAAVQTPQGFRFDVLVRAHRAGAGRDVTDDAALVEALGLRVRAVPGADESFKITTPADLARAEAVARIG